MAVYTEVLHYQIWMWKCACYNEEKYLLDFILSPSYLEMHIQNWEKKELNVFFSSNTNIIAEKFKKFIFKSLHPVLYT